MTNKVAFRGVPFENGIDPQTGDDVFIIIPPLSVNKVREYTQAVSDTTDPDPVKQIQLQNEKVKDVILEAIHKNYPEFTKEELDDFLTYRNLQLAYQAALGTSSSVDGKPLEFVKSVGEIRPESHNL